MHVNEDAIYALTTRDRAYGFQPVQRYTEENTFIVVTEEIILFNVQVFIVLPKEGKNHQAVRLSIR